MERQTAWTKGGPGRPLFFLGIFFPPVSRKDQVFKATFKPTWWRSVRPFRPLREPAKGQNAEPKFCSHPLRPVFKSIAEDSAPGCTKGWWPLADCWWFRNLATVTSWGWSFIPLCTGFLMDFYTFQVVKDFWTINTIASSMAINLGQFSILPKLQWIPIKWR